MNTEPKAVTGRIKPGARCMQDFRYFRWPLEGVDPETRFRITSTGSGLEARADGFGMFRPFGRYGNGAVFVYAAPTPSSV